MVLVAMQQHNNTVYVVKIYCLLVCCLATILTCYTSSMLQNMHDQQPACLTLSSPNYTKVLIGLEQDQVLLLKLIHSVQTLTTMDFLEQLSHPLTLSRSLWESPVFVYRYKGSTQYPVRVVAIHINSLMVPSYF